MKETGHKFRNMEAISIQKPNNLSEIWEEEVGSMGERLPTRNKKEIHIPNPLLFPFSPLEIFSPCWQLQHSLKGSNNTYLYSWFWNSLVKCYTKASVNTYCSLNLSICMYLQPTLFSWFQELRYKRVCST